MLQETEYGLYMSLLYNAITLGDIPPPLPILYLPLNEDPIWTMLISNFPLVHRLCMLGRLLQY